MKNTILGMSALLLVTIGSSDAFASRYGYHNNYNSNNVNSRSGAYSDSTSSSPATGGSAVSAATGGRANAGGGSADNQVSIGGDTTTFRFPVSSAFAPQSINNAGCGQAVGIAGQLRSFGTSLGLPIGNNLDCDADNDANWLRTLGYVDEAIKSKCQKKSMRRAHGGKARGRKARAAECYNDLKTRPVLQAVSIPENFSKAHNHPEIDTKINRAFAAAQGK